MPDALLGLVGLAAVTADILATWGPIAISGAALGVSIFALHSAHRSAKATERSAVADEQAAHRQREPKFMAEIKPATQGRQWHHLTLRLDTPVDLDELTVEILGNELAYSSTQNGVPQSKRNLPRQAWPFDESGVPTGLATGETTGWEVVAVGEYVDSDHVTLLCTAKARGEEWPVLVTVAVPASLRPGPRPDFAHG